MNWYLIHAYAGREDIAAKNLIRQGFSVYNPKMVVKKIRRGKLTKKEEPAFKGYIFIQLDPAVTDVSPIRSTEGCIKLVTFDNRLALVQDRIIDNLKETLRNREEKEHFNKGDKIQVLKGPLKDLSAIYLEPEGESRSIILLNLINKKQRVSIDNNQLS